MTTEIKTSMTIMGTGVFTYLGIKGEVLMLFCCLMVIDTLMRYIGGYIYKDFNSKNARIGIISKITLIFIPVSLAIMFKILGITNINLILFDLNPDQIVSGFWGLLSIAEMHSIAKNWVYLRTGEKPTEYDAVVKLVKKLHSHIQKYLEKFLSN